MVRVENTLYQTPPVTYLHKIKVKSFSEYTGKSCGHSASIFLSAVFYFMYYQGGFLLYVCFLPVRVVGVDFLERSPWGMAEFAKVLTLVCHVCPRVLMNKYWRFSGGERGGKDIPTLFSLMHRSFGSSNSAQSKQRCS